MAWAEFRPLKRDKTARRFHPKKKTWETGAWYVIGEDRLTGAPICRRAGLWSSVKNKLREVGALEDNGAGSVVTIKYACGEFEKLVVKRGNPQTWLAYKAALAKFIAFVDRREDRTVESISRKEMRAFCLHLLEKYCMNGMIYKVGIVRTFLQFCVDCEFIKANPAARITKGFQKVKVAVFLTDDQIRIATDCIDNPAYTIQKRNWEKSRAEFRDIVHTALLTGMREGDVAAFECSWVEDRKIYVVHGKGDKSRVVPVNDELWAILEKYLNIPGRKYVFEGWSKNRIKCQWQVLYKRVKASFPNMPRRCRFHDLRHSFAKFFLRDSKRGGLKRLQLILGHSSIRTTADIYGHLEAEDLVEDMQALRSDFLKPAPLRVIA